MSEAISDVIADAMEDDMRAVISGSFEYPLEFNNDPQ